MAYKITGERISWGACEAECKNNAISEGETSSISNFVSAEGALVPDTFISEIPFLLEVNFPA